MLYVERWWDSEKYYYINRKNVGVMSDFNTSQFLDIGYNIYISILEKYGAYEHNNGNYYFDTVLECENCINGAELLPYIIMKKLQGE